MTATTALDPTDLLREAIAPLGSLTPSQPQGQVHVYVRISKDEADDVHGCIRQAVQQLRYCQSKGLEPITDPDTGLPVFMDNDLSASEFATKPRPSYDRMIAAITAGGPRCILITHLERLTRMPEQLEALLKLTRGGHTLWLHSLSHGPLDMANGDNQAILRVMVTFAAQQSAATSRRLKAANQHHRDEGYAHSGNAHFGYVKGGPGGLSVDRYLAGVIQQTAQDMLNGARLADIARTWNHLGVPRAKKGPGGWTGSQVRSTLESPTLSGWVHHQGEKLHKGKWTPILDDDTHGALLQVLAENSRKYKGGAARRLTAWTGILICEKCQTPMNQSGPAHKRIFRCDPQKGGCGKRGINAPKATAALTAWLLEQFREGGLEKLLAQVDPAEVEQARAEVARIQRLQDEADELREDGTWTLGKYRTEYRRLTTELQQASQALGRAQAKVLKVDEAPPVTLAEWEALPPARQWQAVKLLVSHVVVGDRTTARRNVWDPARMVIHPTHDGEPIRLGQEAPAV